MYSTTTSKNVAKLWSQLESIIDDTAQAGSPALAACTGSGLGGIRVFYPAETSINEVHYSFEKESWGEGGSIENADPKSGVAYNTYNDGPDYQLVNIYYRNKFASTLQQSYIEFGDGEYNAGIKSSLYQTIASGSDIAVCSDETSTEYVVYQAEGGVIFKSTIPPEDSSFTEFKSLRQGGTIGRKLAASYLNSSAPSSGAALTFQSSKSNTTMRLSQWSRSGASLLDIDDT